ncbi:diguanylate cyclase [Herbaspirillum sp. ST 5-3]|uniref:sensor domain-containing diguanylate cyclase n=1 Tax=Oxalobacteraceae TaxID=75682 RepID=UPI0014561D35|nr:diguanylate cyclase [Herbaspirillum sp. ST 5-3]
MARLGCLLMAGGWVRSAARAMALCVLHALILGAAPTALASDVAELSASVDEYPLGRHLQFLEDPSGALTLQDLLSGRFDQGFAHNRSDSPNFGFTDSSYWFRIDLLNRETIASEWLLELQYPLLDYVDVHLIYAGPDKRVVSYRGGDRLPFSQRQVKHHNMVFKVPMKAGEAVSLLMRVRTDSSMQVPMTLWRPHALLERDQKEHLVQGAYYGILIAMLLFNLMIYLSIRDINYLFYVGYLASILLFQSTLNGLAFEYLWPDNPWWGNVSTPFSIGLVYTAIMQFSREFLQLRKNLPRMDKVFKVFLWLFVMVMLVSFALNYTVAIKMATFLTMIATVLLFFTGSLCLKNGVLHAKYFMLAWTVLLVFVFVYTLKTFGILPHVFITEYGLQIGAALETILLSYALAHRLRLLRLENESIQRGITETLERRVRERTSELDQALNNLADANRKLTELSHIDGLTGVGNRAYFNQVLCNEWRRSLRAGEPVSLLLLDIDHFKKVNDTYGHLAGDMCLKQVANAIRAVLQRPADGVFRLGGEEFVVLLPGTDPQGAFHVAERIRQEVARVEVRFEAHIIAVTVSIGVNSVVADSASEEESLIHDADLAMYEAKNKGRNCTCLFKSSQAPSLMPSDPIGP